MAEDRKLELIENLLIYSNYKVYPELGWSIMLCSHISATVEQIITKFATVVSYGK